MDELELEFVEFVLDTRLQSDCIKMGDFPLCRLLLMNDAQYPWFILVPRRAEVSEIYHLSSDDQLQLMNEISCLTENLADLFQARKMNVAALGNVVNQLHVHCIVRYEHDSAWPGPVWGVKPAVAYTPEKEQEIRRKLEVLLDGELDYVPEGDQEG
ncbi:HIT domain-containing protein [Nitrincola sp. MINF-07-Sa-05]|uniref:HIT domain-containing protein n=1 Tax=Nitrincola salilacus TaxID=3400273 RepID=UPI0039182A69